MFLSSVIIKKFQNYESLFLISIAKMTKQPSMKQN